MTQPADFDFNAVTISTADGPNIPLGREHAECVTNSSVRVVTGNLENALIDFVHGADCVFSCFAWLTNYRVLDALKLLPHGCQIIVQKEDFLRPDFKHSAMSYSVLRTKYAALSTPRCGGRYDLPYFGSRLSTACDPDFDAVRCVGVHNSERKSAAPRMHHKFAVSCKCEVKRVNDWYDDYTFLPTAVWTGSFNPTLNGTRSRENAVIVENETIAAFYLKEWSRMFAISEPLNWEHGWVEPEWRIGT